MQRTITYSVDRDQKGFDIIDLTQILAEVNNIGSDVYLVPVVSIQPSRGGTVGVLKKITFTQPR